MDNKPVLDNECYLSQNGPITILCENGRCRVVYSREYPDKLFLILYLPKPPEMIGDKEFIEVVVKELYVGNMKNLCVPFESREPSLIKQIDSAQFYAELINNYMSL